MINAQTIGGAFMSFHHLTEVSRNVKTGKIPVSTSDKVTCPNSCSVKEACYAGSGPLCIHWNKVSKGTQGNTTDWNGFVEKVVAIPNAQLWRHNQAGDLKGEKETIDAYSLDDLIEANKGKRGFTYTHYPIIPEQYNNEDNEVNEAEINEVTSFNKLCVQQANEQGFTVNISADNMQMAEKLFAEGLPTVSIVSEDAPIKGKTENGTPYIVCPAQVFDGKTCKNCGLCQKAKRKQIIAFQVHGSRKKHWKE